MPGGRPLGDLERAVMEQLWKASEPQTVRSVHAALSAQRHLAYTTIMTVLRRLADKGLVVAYRGERAHRYAASQSRDQLVAALMADALAHAADAACRQAALVHFIAHVGTDDVSALLGALADLEAKHAVS